jgi:chromosome segregation ATPase
MLNEEQSANAPSELRDRLIGLSTGPSDAAKLSTARLVHHFFYDAALMRSQCFQMKSALTDFSRDFRQTLSGLRQRVQEGVTPGAPSRSDGVSLSQKASVDVVQSKLTEAYAQMKTLASSYSTLKEKLQAATRELTEARLSNERLAQALKEETEENQTLAESLRRFMVNRGTTRAASQPEGTADNSEAAPANLQELLEAAQAETTSLKRNLRRKEREANKIYDRLQVTKRQMLTLQTISSETTVRCANDCFEIKAENKKLLQRVDELESEIAFLRQSHSKINSVLRDSTNHYEQEIKSLSEQLTHERSVAKRTSQTLEARIKPLEKSKSSLAVDVTRLEGELVKERHECSLLERKVSSQATVLRDIRAENVELARRCDLLSHK